MLGQEAQAHDERLLEGSQAVLLLARIDDIEEDRGGGGGPRESVLDGGVGGVQLGRDRILGDVLVVWREGIPRKTEGADPQTGAHINLAGRGEGISNMRNNSGRIEGSPVGVQHGAAGLLATNRVELQQRCVGLLLERGIKGADGDDEPGSFLWKGSAMDD